MKVELKWYLVKVFFPADDVLSEETYYDEIQGLSPEHALKRAYWNWDRADRIEIIE